jgi:hypothetical protein
MAQPDRQSDKKAQVYFYQKDTRRLPLKENGRIPKKIGAQLFLGDRLLAEIVLSLDGYGIPNLCGSAYEAGQFIRAQIERRGIPNYEIKEYHRFNGPCLKKGEILEGEDSIAHLRAHFLMGFYREECLFPLPSTRQKAKLC